MTQLDVRVGSIFAVKPELIRIQCYTVDSDTSSTRDYEIVIHTNQFTHRVDGNVQIDLDALRDYISREIISARDTAELAYVLDQTDLHWTIDVHAVPTETSPLPDKTLAYGATE